MEQKEKKIVEKELSLLMEITLEMERELFLAVSKQN